MTPQSVHPLLKKYLLLDGFDIVVDLERSHGSWLVDAKSGREFLDFFTCVGSMPVGYNHPRVLAAREQITMAAVNKPSNSDLYSLPMAIFVETFFKAVPKGFPHGFFISGGTLAVENALKAAFDWKVKKNFKKGYGRVLGSQVIHFKEAFHGRSGYTLSLTNTDPRKIAYFPKFDWPRITAPKLHFPETEESTAAVETLEQQALREIQGAIHERGDDIAALIIEPIQGEGGDNHFRKEFFQALRTICNESEIMLIFDEVQTGLGLTGQWWAWQHFDVVPDLFAFGKKTQVCGFVSTERIDEIDDNVFREASRINSTWGGSLVDMVRSTIYLHIIEEERLIDNARIEGKYLLSQLEALQLEFPALVSNARGRGLMCAFDLPSEESRNTLLQFIFNNGAIILGCGKRSIRFRPPLNLSHAEIERMVDILRHSLLQLVQTNLSVAP